MLKRISIYIFSMMLTICTHAAQTIQIDGYAAKVNDRIITVADVLQAMAPLEAQLRMRYEGSQLEEQLEKAYAQARNALIERALILENFKLKDVGIPIRIIEERVDEIINQQFDNNRTLFLQSLAEQRMTIDDFKKKVEESLIVSLSRQEEITSHTVVSPRKIQDLYAQLKDELYTQPEKIRLRVIVLNKGDSETDQTTKQAEAQSIIDKLSAGAAFEELAREFSEGSKAATGGDWGWIEPTDLRDEFRTAIAEIKTGQISDIIEIEGSLYILQVEARKEAGITPLDQVRDELELKIKSQEEEELYNAWMERLKKRHYVQIFDN